jgi:hypothetical protein
LIVAQLWIEYTDENGDAGSVRWAGGFGDSEIDAVIGFAIDTIDRMPDTIV